MYVKKSMVSHTLSHIWGSPNLMKYLEGNEVVSDFLCLKGNHLQIASPKYFQMRCPWRALGWHWSSQFKSKINNDADCCLSHLSVNSSGEIALAAETGLTKEPARRTSGRYSSVEKFSSPANPLWNLPCTPATEGEEKGLSKRKHISTQPMKKMSREVRAFWNYPWLLGNLSLHLHLSLTYVEYSFIKQVFAKH